MLILFTVRVFVYTTRITTSCSASLPKSTACKLEKAEEDLSENVNHRNDANGRRRRKSERCDGYKWQCNCHNVSQQGAFIGYDMASNHCLLLVVIANRWFYTLRSKSQSSIQSIKHDMSWCFTQLDKFEAFVATRKYWFDYQFNYQNLLSSLIQPNFWFAIKWNGKMCLHRNFNAYPTAMND